MKRDEIFWRAAYQEHAPAVLAFLRSRLANRDEAEDLLQETFVRSIRAGSFREGGNLRGYLLSVARNLMINQLRRPRLVVPAKPRDDDGDALDGVDPEAVSPEKATAWRAFRRELDEVLDGLSESHREAFRLGILEQKSYQEIGELTGWSASLVKVNIFRARKHVTEALGDRLPETGWSLS